MERNYVLKTEVGEFDALAICVAVEEERGERDLEQVTQTALYCADDGGVG